MSPGPGLGTEPSAQASTAESLARAGFDAFDQLATMVALVDAEGHCLMANSALENTLGVSRRSLQRSSVTDWLAQPDRLQETLHLVSSNRGRRLTKEARRHVMRNLTIVSGCSSARLLFRIATLRA